MQHDRKCSRFEGREMTGILRILESEIKREWSIDEVVRWMIYGIPALNTKSLERGIGYVDIVDQSLIDLGGVEFKKLYIYLFSGEIESFGRINKEPGSFISFYEFMHDFDFPDSRYVNLPSGIWKYLDFDKSFLDENALFFSEDDGFTLDQIYDVFVRSSDVMRLFPYEQCSQRHLIEELLDGPFTIELNNLENDSGENGNDVSAGRGRPRDKNYEKWLQVLAALALSGKIDLKTRRDTILKEVVDEMQACRFELPEATDDTKKRDWLGEIIKIAKGEWEK
mgnify:CR=1 FL=1